LFGSAAEWRQIVLVLDEVTAEMALSDPFVLAALKTLCPQPKRITISEIRDACEVPLCERTVRASINRMLKRGNPPFTRSGLGAGGSYEYKLAPHD
jgi:hypothetical protein